MWLLETLPGTLARLGIMSAEEAARCGSLDFDSEGEGFCEGPPSRSLLGKRMRSPGEDLDAPEGHVCREMETCRPSLFRI